MKPRPIDTLATWLPMNTNELDVKVFTDYHYTQGGIMVSASQLKPVLRYAKNYNLNGKRYSLCIITLEQDTKAMELWLDLQTKNIKEEHITDGFKLLDIKYQ